MQSKALQSRIALVTGASSGIGARTALLLAKNGLHVILVARRLDRLEELASEINNLPGQATIIQADLSLESERLRLFHRITTLNLLPDILVNNAGLAWYGYFFHMPWKVAREIIALNIEGSTQMIQLFLPHMQEKKYGRIINIGSIAGKLPEQGIAVYSASKAYLDAITTSINRDLRGTGVSVSVIRAGPVKTEFFDIARNLENGKSIPAESLAVSPELVARKVLKLIKRPQRVSYVPFYLVFSPLLEALFSGIIDLVGPLLLRYR